MLNNFKKVQVVVENTFVTCDKNSEELKLTVFDRAFRKLTDEKSEIGKIFPIYLKIDDVYYVLGVFTLNRLGSTSFFPELPEGTFFDHITLGKNLAKCNAHLTYITNGKRKKVTPISAVPLSNGMYHLITFIFQDFKLLKLAPKDVRYPPVDIGFVESLKDALFTRNGFNGSGSLDAVGTGPVIIQIFLIPKNVDFKNLQFTKVALDPLLKYFNDDDALRNVKKHIAYLKHEFQDEYQFGLLAFRYPTKITGPAYIGYSVDKSGFYFNSPDKKLEKSVFKHVRKKS